MPINTTTFSVSWEVPVSPERIARLQSQIDHLKATEEPSTELGKRISNLEFQMLSEKRTDPAPMRSHVGPDGRVVNWDCPRCGSCEGLTHVLAHLRNGQLSMIPSCPECGATVNRHDHPMSLDLYRMRTQRTDGVEVSVQAAQ